MERKSIKKRKTKETEIEVELNIDDNKASNISTGIGFFDHMLNSFMTHGRFSGSIITKGDIEVDFHHSVEDTGIVLGLAFLEALADKSNIARFGTAFVPMDETLAMASVDISGRPYLVFDVDFPTQKIGEMDTELFIEFFRAFAMNSGMTIHIKLLYGSNSHHIAEAVFKALARAIRQAVTIDNSVNGVLSTKGLL